MVHRLPLFVRVVGVHRIPRGGDLVGLEEVRVDLGHPELLLKRLPILLAWLTELKEIEDRRVGIDPCWPRKRPEGRLRLDVWTDDDTAGAKGLTWRDRHITDGAGLPDLQSDRVRVIFFFFDRRSFVLAVEQGQSQQKPPS